MWVLSNRTPYAADRNWTRDKFGRHHWVVAVRATFDIDVRGKLTLADEQPLPPLAPEYRGEAGMSSLLWDSDLLYVRPCTDVIAEAHAHAPGGRPRRYVHVGLHVGPIKKQLLVHGSRVFYRGMSGVAISPAEPFVSRPITYEWAYGGMDLAPLDPKNQVLDERNPVGKGVALDSDRLIDTPAPAIEYLRKKLAKAGPAGFGPVDPAWLPRRTYAGTYDERWEKTKKPLLPDDYDDLYGSSAPSDQRVLQYLRGGELVEIVGMTQEGVMRFELPKIHLAFTSHFGDRHEEHRGNLVTVLILTEERKVSLTWQSTLFVRAKECDYLDQTDIVEKAYLF